MLGPHRPVSDSGVEQDASNTSDAKDRVIELEQLADVPGTYFNPQTEVLVVVDDSSSIDQEIFNMEPYEGADWIRISDEVPVDEEQRDRILEDSSRAMRRRTRTARTPAERTWTRNSGR